MQDLRIAALKEGGLLDEVVDRALQALVHQEPVAPAVLRLLVRHYVTTGRGDLEAAIGPALARALDICGSEVEQGARSDWILLFVDAAALSPEECLRTAASSLLVCAAHDWPAAGDVGSAMRSIDGCLRAVDLIPDNGEAHRLIAATIDELERIVGPCYRPGEGLAHAIADAGGERGNLRDQVNTAAALLTAYEVTGRLPYSMLAEEVMQFARRLQPETTIDPGTLNREDFVACCEAVRVLCRVASLHGDAEYRRAAVIAPETDYADRSADLLRWLAGGHRQQDVSAAAEFGISFSDWLTFR